MERNEYEAVQCMPLSEEKLRNTYILGKYHACEARNRGPRVAFANPNPTYLYAPVASTRAGLQTRDIPYESTLTKLCK